MRKRLVAVALGSFVAGAVLLNSPDAMAVLGVGDTVTDPGLYGVMATVQSAITGAIQSMMNNMVSSITGLQTSLNSILTQGFTQEANYSKAQIGAQEQIADASNMANAQFQRNIRNAQVRDQHILSPEACIALDSGQSMTSASEQASKVSTAIGSVMDARGEGTPGTPAWSGQAQAMAATTQLHLSRYCDQDESQAGLCTTVRTAEINGDQRAASLFADASYPDQAAINAANDYATELIQPVVPAAIRGDALTSVSGQDAEAERRGYNAQMSLARGVLNDVVASRASAVTLTTAQQQQMQAEGLTPTSTGSWYESVDLEVNRHLSGTDWAASLQYMPEKSVLVEIATELALNNYIAWQNFQLAQKNASVNAAQLADAARERLKPIQSMPSPQLAQ
jgi:hypothetical protein